MHGGHHHDHSHDHQGHAHAPSSEGRLLAAMAINLLLTLGEIAGSSFSGSLALLSDALHNFGDVGSLLIAYVALRISRRPADAERTFGYRRAETVGALINLLVLLISGFYLLVEAGMRFLHPEAVQAVWVIAIAGAAFVVNLGTVALTIGAARGSMNMRAAFLHGISDAAASLGVIVAGVLIWRFGWQWADALISAAIAGYIIWQGFSMLPQVVHLLMEGTPPHLSVAGVTEAMQTIEGVARVHHMHLWQLDETRCALEAHVLIADMARIEPLRASLKAMLDHDFGIDHSTLEFETSDTPGAMHACHLPENA